MSVRPARARSAAVSKGVAGTTTAPSFIAPSITSHNAVTLPSISRMRSPRRIPSTRRPLATRLERSESAAKLRRAAPSPTMCSAGWAAVLPCASSASNQSSAQLKSSSGQTKPAQAA